MAVPNSSTAPAAWARASAADFLLRLRGVGKRYGAVVALARVDLDVAAGSTVALVGPSGGGKSTLLRVVNGLIRPDTGSVRIGGRVLTPRSATGLRLRMGYVIQEGGLFPHLTARANLALQPRWAGWPRRLVAARVEELAVLTRLPGEALDRYPAQLSGGQRQRVALMRALMLDPELLLLDEPLGALDPLIRSELQADLRTIFRALGKTVVLVTHDLAEARYFADRLVLLHQGRVVQEGAYEELVAAPAEPFVGRFVAAQRLLHGADDDGDAGPEGGRQDEPDDEPDDEPEGWR